MHSCLKEEIDPTDCRLYTGSISIVEYGNVFGETTDQAYLFSCEGCTAGGHYIFDTGLMHGNYIHIPLHQVDLVFLSDRLFGKIKSVQFATL